MRFANAPVDAAVRTICEMADLAVIEDANVLVVTTRERASARMKMEVEKRKAETLALAAPNIGLSANNQVFQPNWLGGVGGLGGEGSGPDLSVEIARLRDQNERVQKQLDEVMKLLKK